MIRWLQKLFLLCKAGLPAPQNGTVVYNWYGRTGRGMPQ